MTQVRPPGAGKDIVGQIVAYLRQNNGAAVINSHDLSERLGCSQSCANWDIRRLKSCGIITTTDKYGQGHRNTTFRLADEFKEGDGWIEVLLNHAPLMTHKKSVPGEKSITAAMVIINHLRANGGRAMVNGSNLARESGFCQPAISYALRSLVKKGLIVTNGSLGSGHRSPELELTEKGKGCVIPELLREIRKTNDEGVAKNTPKNLKASNDIILKLSLSRELVQLYERLKEEQDKNTRLQAENQDLRDSNVGLEAVANKLNEELAEERATTRHNVNEIAQLELRLRDLRSDTDPKARRIRFDNSGFQV